MIRLIRLLLYLMVGLLLGASVTLAFAGTYNATITWRVAGIQDNASSVTACSVAVSVVAPNYLPWVLTYTGTTNNSALNVTCNGVITRTSDGVTSPVNYATALGSYSCPNGGTLQDNLCVKDCTAPLQLQTDGTCSCPDGQHLDSGTNTCVPDDKCAPTKGKENSGWVVKPSGGYGGTVCIDGCNYQQVMLIDLSNPQDERIGKDGRIWGQVSQTGLGTSCSASSPEQGQPDQNNKQAHKPDCAAGEGVMTSTSGHVLCVPEGTPDARKPDVQKKTKEETAPNGDKTKTETTTTTDPQTNAKETTTTTTTTTSAGTTKSTSTESSSGNVGTSGGTGGDGSCTGENCTDNASPGKFGDYGDIWEKKYPGGLSKVLSDRYNELKATKIFTLVADLAPQGVANSGTCPEWSFNANIGPKMNFGSGSYSPPCWLWTALRAVFIITALLAARRLVFGG